MPPNKNQVINQEAHKEPYAAVFTFAEAESVIFSAKKKYEAAVSIGQTSLLMRTITCFFDIGAGPNLLLKDFDQPAGLQLVRPCEHL